MLSALRQTVIALLGSKKFVMAVLTVIAGLAAKYGLGFDPASALALLSPFIAAIVGQGIADHGKSAAEVSVAAGPAPAAATPGSQSGFIAVRAMVAVVIVAIVGVGACAWWSSSGKPAATAGAKAGLSCAKQDILSPLEGDGVSLLSKVSQALLNGAGMTAIDDGYNQAKADLQALPSTLEHAAVDCAIQAAIAAFSPAATGKGFAGGDARLTAAVTIGQRLLTERASSP